MIQLSAIWLCLFALRNGWKTSFTKCKWRCATADFVISVPRLRRWETDTLVAIGPNYETVRGNIFTRSFPT